jgi:uncharacterized protein YbjT (DUF2867 family)
MRSSASLRMAESATARTVLVTGAAGFIAGFIVAALRDAGWRVLRAERAPRAGDVDARRCDFSQPMHEAQLDDLLCGVDAVVNVAGILRQTRTQRFDAIHLDGPLALARGCVARGIRAYVQISALGRPDDGEFIASKHRFDAALRLLPLRSVVLRPSVVYSTAGSYGGTSLLRALAASPGIVPLPGQGEWKIQPVAAEDLAALVRVALEREVAGTFEVGGPRVVTLRDYLALWRAWLRLPPAREWNVPLSLVRAGVALGERLGRGPMSASVWTLLQRGNVTGPGAHALVQQQFGIAPRALEQVLASRPSQGQDRWHARLYPLAPVLRMGIVLLFLLSAWAGFATSAETIHALVAGSPLATLWPVELARTAAGADLLLGLMLAFGLRTHATLAAMLVLVAGYTLAFGLLLPAQWLDPLGGLAKNLVILPALAVLWVLADRR